MKAVVILNGWHKNSSHDTWLHGHQVPVFWRFSPTVSVSMGSLTRIHIQNVHCQGMKVIPFNHCCRWEMAFSDILPLNLEILLYHHDLQLLIDLCSMSTFLQNPSKLKDITASCDSRFQKLIMSYVNQLCILNPLPINLIG